MSDRHASLIRSLHESKWKAWQVDAIETDASSRRYFRLSGPEGKTAILVDAPPDVEDFRRFLEIANHLQAAGLCVPEALYSDHENGFFVLSDLGRKTLAMHLGQFDKTDYGVLDSILDILFVVRQAELPNCRTMTHGEAIKMLEPLYQFYGVREQRHLEDALGDAFDRFVSTKLIPSLRDFHAENLIWRGGERGPKHLGVLDFQDAFLAPEGYDLASYTRDVRRSVPERERIYLEENFAHQVGLSLIDFQLQVALLAVQRNLRILGVFAKQIQSGKPKYAKFMPRVWDYLMADLIRPELAQLNSVVRTNLSSPIGQFEVIR